MRNMCVQPIKSVRVLHVRPPTRAAHDRRNATRPHICLLGDCPTHYHPTQTQQPQGHRQNLPSLAVVPLCCDHDQPPPRSTPTVGWWGASAKPASYGGHIVSRVSPGGETQGVQGQLCPPCKTISACTCTELKNGLTPSLLQAAGVTLGHAARNA